MAGQATVLLDYDGTPSKLALMRHRLRRGVPFLVLICSIAYIVYRGPVTSTDIRLDTGDVRIRYYGIPLLYHRTPEPQRSRLLLLAANSSTLKSEWHTCQCPAFWQYYYETSASWYAEDENLGVLIAEDMASDIRRTNGSMDWPESLNLLCPRIIEMHGGKVAVKVNWRNEADVRAFMKLKSYTRPSTQPAAKSQ